MSLVSEFLQKVGLIRNETQYHGNTKERVADTFETLFNLDVWFKKLDPQDPNANKIYQADGTLIDLPTPAPKQIQQIPTYNDLPVPGEEGIVYYIIDEDEDYAWSDDLNDYYDYVEPKGFLDDRGSNLVGDLTEQEKAIIKDKLGVEDYNGVTPTITENVITSYDIDVSTQTEHWNLTMTGDTDFDFTNMFASGHSKVITITLGGDYAFAFPSWLRSLETNDYYDTIGGAWVAEIVINIKNGGTNPSGYYSLQMVYYAV